MKREEAIKLIEHISLAFVPTDQYGDYDDPQPYEEALNMATEALSAEAVEIVRCKDCKHRDERCGMGEHRWCRIIKMSTAPNNFCSFGERREP